MDTETELKWDAASRNFDLFTFGDDHRLGPHKALAEGDQPYNVT